MQCFCRKPVKAHPVNKVSRRGRHHSFTIVCRLRVDIGDPMSLNLSNVGYFTITFPSTIPTAFAPLNWSYGFSIAGTSSNQPTM